MPATMPEDGKTRSEMADMDFSGLREWLESPQGGELMDRVARSVRDTVVSRNLPLTFINKDPFGSRTDSDLFQEIRSELLLFILENAELLKRHLICGERNFPALVKQRFISRWLTGARTPAMDPFRYLYKRAQDLLREQEGFFTLSKKGRSTSYSRKAQNRAIPPLAEEDLRSIPFPTEHTGRLNDGAVKTGAAILGLAAYFWERVHDLWGKEAVWVDIRDFVTWIGRHVQLNRVSMSAEFPGDESESREFTGEDLQSGEGRWDPVAVKSWALQFFHQVDRKKLQIFRLFHQEKQTLGEIARKMGYKGSSGPKYVVDHVAATLQFFLRDLPWLSPDDLDEEAFALFFDTLFDLLKNRVAEP